MVTRGQVSVRMDTKRNIRRGNQNEPLIMSTTQMRITGGYHLVEQTGSVPVRLVTRGQVSVRMDTKSKRNIRRRVIKTSQH